MQLHVPDYKFCSIYFANMFLQKIYEIFLVPSIF